MRFTLFLTPSNSLLFVGRNSEFYIKKSNIQATFFPPAHRPGTRDFLSHAVISFIHFNNCLKCMFSIILCVLQIKQKLLLHISELYFIFSTGDMIKYNAFNDI